LSPAWLAEWVSQAPIRAPRRAGRLPLPDGAVTSQGLPGTMFPRVMNRSHGLRLIMCPICMHVRSLRVPARRVSVVALGWCRLLVLGSD